MATPQPAPAKQNKLLIIIGAAIVVLLAVIAVSVSSQAIRAGQEADAKASAAAEASKAAVAAAASEKVIADQKAADADNANTACKQQVLEKHPTAAFEDDNAQSVFTTKSTFNAYDNSYEIVGYFTDEPLYDNKMTMQFVCSSTRNGMGWNADLKTLGRQ